ncbi:karyopherin beta [Angomonas deanei]|nr:karyopherin beta [Angomonas deanei]|eukprot:EPY31999.1 karyopherin beta [Angomonas deanei]
MCSKDSGPELKITCCEVIAEASIQMTPFFEVHLQALGTGIEVCLSEEGPLAKDLHQAALQTVSSVSAGSQQIREEMKQLVPAILDMLQRTVYQKNWDSAAAYLSVILEMFDNADDGTIFDDSLVPLLTGLMQMASSYDVDKDVRQISIETMLSISENSPKKVRKIPDFLSSFFTLMFQYSVEPAFVDDWDVNAELDDFEDDLPDSLVASAALDRLATSLGGRKLFNVAYKLFSENVGSPDWKGRYAALSLLSAVTEGMTASLLPILGELLSSVVKLCKDECKYVRQAALTCLTGFSASFREDFLPMSESAVAAALESLKDPIPHIQMEAANFFENYYDMITDVESDDAEAKQFSIKLAQYNPQVYGALLGCLENTSLPNLQNSILACFASITDVMKDECAPFVERVVNASQRVLGAPEDPKLMDVKNKALQCVTVLGAAVGGEIFRPYSYGVCEYLKERCAHGLETGDNARYILRGWSCMAECVGANMAQYLPIIMPILLQRLEAEDVSVGEDDLEEEDDDAVSTYRINIPGAGVKKVTINTETTQDKQLAFNICVSFLKDIDDNMVDYYVPLANCAIKSLGNVHEEIVQTSAMVICTILENMIKKEMPGVKDLARAAFEPVSNTIDEDTDVLALYQLSTAFAQCIHAAPEVVTHEACSMITEKLVDSVKECVKVYGELSNAIATEKDEDEVDGLEDKRGDIEQNFESIMDCVQALLQYSANVFAQSYVHNFFPIISQWAATENEFLLTKCYSSLSDFTEYAPQHALPLLPPLVERVLVILTSTKDEGILQSGVYFLKLTLDALPPNDESAVRVAQSARDALVKYLYVPDARSNIVYLDATCNFISCFSVLLEKFYNTNSPNLNEDVQLFTSFLPVGGDMTEAVRVHDRVLTWVSQGLPHIVNLPGAAPAMIERIKTASPDALSDEAKAHLSQM